VSLTILALDVGSPADPTRFTRVELLVDSGAVYSVVPTPVLDELGIKPLTEEEFRLANGEAIRRKKGVALFRYAEKIGGADVIFGEPGDSQLLGALTLESLGLVLDPLRRELKPLPMILAGWKPARALAT
jgi:predicted aspartyl protease